MCNKRIAAGLMKKPFDCLLPTGMMVTVTLDDVRLFHSPAPLLPHNPLSLQAKCTFADIKSEVWKAAKKLPFFSMLKREDQYGIRGILADGESCECEDSMQLKHVNLYQGVLKVCGCWGSFLIFLIF